MRQRIPTRIVVYSLWAILTLGNASWAQPPGVQRVEARTGEQELHRPIAYIYKNVPISRAAFGEYLIERFGKDKLELFVNRVIIESEAKRRNITVTKAEMDAAFLEDLQGMPGGGVSKSDFVKIMLPKYNKTLYEWMEDVIRPRLLLTKMCHDRIKVSDTELKIQYERRYGEMRDVQMIIFPKGDKLDYIQKVFEQIRNDGDEFDRVARAQANPALAASAGRTKPITRHLSAVDRSLEEMAFKLKPGEVSHIMNTQHGYIIMKLIGVIPANKNVPFEKEKEKLYKAAYDEILAQEIPKYFAELKAQADPQLFYNGPSQWNPAELPTVNTPTPGPNSLGTLPPMPIPGLPSIDKK